MITDQNFAQRDRFKRVSQKEILPTAVKSRNLASFVFGSDTASASSAMNNGDNVDIDFTLTQNNEYELLANNYIAIYVGTVSLANQIFPEEGSSQDITAWQITGPAFNWHDWDANSFPAHKEYMTMNVENVSAGSVTINVRGKWRYISPREGS